MNVFQWIVCTILICYSTLAQAVTEETESVDPTYIGSHGAVQQVEVNRSNQSVLTVEHKYKKKKVASAVRKVPAIDESELWDLYRDEKFQQLHIEIDKREELEKGWKPSSELRQALIGKDTDERELWNLYHQKKYTEVYHRIDGLIKRYPGWSPSSGLLEALQAARLDEQDLWGLIEEKKFREVKLIIQQRQQKDDQWQASQKLMIALEQGQTDERPLWELYHQGKTEELGLKITALKLVFPDWNPSLELRQATGGSIESNEISSSNEAVIWTLIHQQKYRQAIAAIKDMKAEQADWKPSDDMQRSLRDGLVDSKIRYAVANEHWHQVLATAQRHPEAFDCSHYHRRLQLSDALVHKRSLERAARVYKKSIWQCKDYIRIDTIEHALDRLPASYLEPLFKKLATRKDSKATKGRMAIARYRYIMKKGAEKTDLPILFKDEPTIIAHNNGSLTASLAWNYLMLGENRHALNLFRNARAIKDQDDLLKGEILALDRLNDMASLKTSITTYHERLKQAGMLKDLLPLLGKACAEENNAQCKVDTFRELKTYRPLTVSEAEILAWGLYNIDHYSEAAENFEMLYKREQNENNAKGAYVSMYKTGRMETATELAATYKGPLVKLLGSKVAEHLYQRRQFHASFEVSDEPEEAMKNLDSSWVRAGYWMSSNRMPVMKPVILQFNQKHFVVKGVNYLDKHSGDALSIEIDHVFLDAGAPIIPVGDLAGTAPIVPVPASFPIRSRLQGYEWKMGYVHEGWKSWFVHLGQGFIGGSVPATFKGDIGILNQLEQGFVGAKLYREPVRDFLLPYVGLQDPFSPQRWGKVSRNGIEVEGYQNIRQVDGLGLSYKLNVELLDGRNVELNNHISSDITLPYSFQFEQANFSIGPNIRWERYQTNQMHWTVGHGGYFSPQHWFSWGVNADLVSKEGENSSFRVFASAGYQIFTQEQSLVLPLANDGRLYPAAKIRNRHETLEAQFLHRFTDHLHIEVGAKSSSSHLSRFGKKTFFSTWEGHAFATWYFDKRPATFTPELEDFKSNVDSF